MPRFEFSRESSAVPGHDRGDGDILLRDMRDLSPSVRSMQPLSEDSGCLVSFFLFSYLIVLELVAVCAMQYAVCAVSCVALLDSSVAVEVEVHSSPVL